MGNPFVWTGTNALAALRTTIGDPDPGGNYTPHWSDAELVGYLNRAQLQVVLETETVIESVWTTALVDGQREYKLPAAFHKATGVDYIATARSDVRPLEPLEWQEYRDLYLNDEDAEGAPCWYYFWRKTGDDPTTTQPASVYIHPTPGSAEDGKDIEIHGYKHPDAIAAGDLTPVLELEAPYVEAAISWAAMTAMTDDGDTSIADRLERRYAFQISQIRQALVQKDRSSVSRIRPRGERDLEYSSTYWTPWS